MTHTLHRTGPLNTFHEDYIILARTDPLVSAQLTYQGPLQARVKKLLNIMIYGDPIALDIKTEQGKLRYIKDWNKEKDSGIHKSASIYEIRNCADLLWVEHAVYNSIDKVKVVLESIAEADLGISIVVSGIMDSIIETCKQLNNTPHAANMSLGIWGKTELLPDEGILDICTMCGHGILSSKLVEKQIHLIKIGKLKIQDAVIELGKQCTCNIFNTKRAHMLMEKIINTEK